MRKTSNEKNKIFFFNGVLCPDFPEKIPLFFLMLLLVNILNSYFKAANNCWQSCKCSDKYSKALIATICWSFWKELKHVLYILHYHKKKNNPNQNNNKNPNKNKPQSNHVFQVCAVQQQENEQRTVHRIAWECRESSKERSYYSLHKEPVARAGLAQVEAFMPHRAGNKAPIAWNAISQLRQLRPPSKRQTGGTKDFHQGFMCILYTPLTSKIKS